MILSKKYSYLCTMAGMRKTDNSGMKFYFSILLSLITLLAKGQAVKFQLHRINPCNGKETMSHSYGLSYYLTDTLVVTDFLGAPARYVLTQGDDPKNPSKKHVFDSLDKKGNLVLPKTGKYYLYIDENDNPEPAPITINIQHRSVFVYKYTEPKVVYQNIGFLHAYWVYINCDTLAEGYVEDLYPNGKMRLRGNFEKGNTKDSLVLFYANGNVARQFLRLPNEEQNREFDSLGNLRLITQTSTEYVGTPSMHVSKYALMKSYFENGQLRTQVSDYVKSEDEDSLLINAYYENGKPQLIQTKNSRTEYYENGNKKDVYTWTRKKAYGGFDYTTKQDNYDENENLTETIEYENWDSGFYSPTMDVSRSDKIDKWMIYKNGKAIIKAENVATKDYFGNTDNQK